MEGLHLLLSFLAQHGYWSVGLGMAAESAAIPLPSEVILPFGGFLAATGRLSFWWVVAAAVVGQVAGSVALYLLGSLGGRPLVLRYGQYLLITPGKLARVDRFFQRYGGISVLLARMLPVLRTYVSLPAGVARMDFEEFLAFTVAGSVPWTAGLVYAGFLLGRRWTAILPWFHRGQNYILAALIIALAVYVLQLRRRLPASEDEP
ncbi:MAG: DedA family protein [Thermaerobacter sp.]|nr:DedA family protein [Thermaerobacter sp.]